ncbi:MAG TPA: carboxylating nicotinate-nucleotide diphosphorylase [Candidatus Binataceae bacterium]|jgi:nicotinate-nucleotide pyrophosphorylase (carboxylating)|nr:carboxylating nicotinate-nucleotide diphosphorylase [Candidatus Binataceae bacterium]
MELLQQSDLVDLLRRALAEDIGQGDITTAATVPHGARGRARITVKEADGIVFCGGLIIEQVFALTFAEPIINSLAAEGARLHNGVVAADIEGDLAGLLSGERVALNFAQLMSGIATTTAHYVAAVKGTRARIIDTRKTHPGLRAIEKYAVRCGGGTNHRFGLDSGVLIKENHIAAAGGVRAALEGARRLAPHTLRIQIECETLAQVEEAVANGAGAILLDNMSLEEMRRARAMVGPAIILEASGGVTLETVRAIAETGVDLISVGALTHSARAVDLSMRIEVR